MLRLLAVCGLLTTVLSILETEFDFGGDDETTLETLLKEQGFSEEEVETILQVRWLVEEQGSERVGTLLTNFTNLYSSVFQEKICHGLLHNQDNIFANIVSKSQMIPSLFSGW